MTLAPTLIVFDCDGTLVDSQYLIAEAMRQAFLASELSPPERADILRTVGLSIPEAMKRLSPEQLPETREELCQNYRDCCTFLRRQHGAKEPLFPGAASLLLNLAARDDVLLGIATGKSRRGVARFIEQNDLEGIFSTIQTADDAPSKPHPAMLLQAMEMTGASPETTVMIGDTAFDMIMATCANVASIGVTWGYHSIAELKRSSAKTIVRSFAALAHELEDRHPLAARYEAVA